MTGAARKGSQQKRFKICGFAIRADGRRSVLHRHELLLIGTVVMGDRALKRCG
jgi:hypothetical protein